MSKKFKVYLVYNIFLQLNMYLIIIQNDPLTMYSSLGDLRIMILVISVFSSSSLSTCVYCLARP